MLLSIRSTVSDKTMPMQLLLHRINRTFTHMFVHTEKSHSIEFVFLFLFK